MPATHQASRTGGWRATLKGSQSSSHPWALRRGQSRRTSGRAGREGSWAPYGDLEIPGLQEAGASEGPLENTAFSTRRDHWRHLVDFLFKRKTKKDTKHGSGRTRFSCQPHDHVLGISFGFPSHQLGLLGEDVWNSWERVRQTGASHSIPWASKAGEGCLPVAGCCEDVGYTALADLAHSTVCVCMLSRFSHVWLVETLQTVAHQPPLSMGFSRQEY